MGFTGEEKLGSVARLWRERGSRRLGCGLPIGQGVHRRKSRCRDRYLNKQLFAQTAPPPLRGRGTGRGQMRLRLPWERICAQYGFGFFAPEKSKFVSSTASDRKGFVKGESVPLDRILVPFVRTKGTPRRRAVQIMLLQKAARRRRQSQTGPRRIGEIKPGHSLCRQPLSQPCG